MTAPDHPYTDPGDGRQECQACGKWVWLVTHSGLADAGRDALIKAWDEGEKSGWQYGLHGGYDEVDKNPYRAEAVGDDHA